MIYKTFVEVHQEMQYAGYLSTGHCSFCTRGMILITYVEDHPALGT
jgi:hypothetical protein